ncbi:unnamed protein product [Arabidopsis thaliana]|uniref:Thioredoxin domain-containing protein n=1 Tax=Arabidopsis thaliana TaxID=3702 RepID=A0A654FNG0_ARATH|nr:unnamed protein product [Arabidopsis thaliana]
MLACVQDRIRIPSSRLTCLHHYRLTMAWPRTAECGILMPELEFLDSEYEYMLKFYTVDTDEELELAKDYRIEYHPITIVFKGGEEKERVLGYYPQMLGQLANKYL